MPSALATTRRAMILGMTGLPLAARVAGAAELAGKAAMGIEALRAAWDNPSASAKPQLRWWWQGGAVTKPVITREFESMAAQGIGGVEIMHSYRVYEKGNTDYLSPAWLKLARHAVLEAKRLGMTVDITAGAGWSFGGDWVPPADRSKVLAPAIVEVEGPARFDAALPEYKIENPRPLERQLRIDDPGAPDFNAVLAVVAGRLDGNKLLGESLVDLSDRLKGDRLAWDVPEGRWRIMAFRILYTGQQNQAQTEPTPQWVVDHLSTDALVRFFDHFGGKLEEAFGEEFGTTVTSLFCDSFEIHPLPNTLLWSNDTLARFKPAFGYDFTKYLPAIWGDVGPLTEKLRYDINRHLHQVGLDTTFKVFIDWCAKHKLTARIQPHYRFVTELIEASGMTPRPETEHTTANFETRAYPRKSTTSGARLYGHDLSSAEAYTFLSMQRYSYRPEQIKAATDAFLRDGVNQIYAMGYVSSPEVEIAPARDVPWAHILGAWNPWWRYYGHIARYTARCCELLRQGEFVADVLLYAPQAAIWSERGIFGSEHRDIPYGNVPQTLIENGYDYDVVNDDLLQNRVRVEKGRLTIGPYSWRALILLDIRALPLKTLEVIEAFAEAGGLVISLGRVPQSSVGVKNAAAEDAKVHEIVGRLFAPGGPGVAFADYRIDRTPVNPLPRPWTPPPKMNAQQRSLIAALQEQVAPDVRFDGGQSQGLSFNHRRVGDIELYFVANLSPLPLKTRASFRVGARHPELWDAVTGEIAPLRDYTYEDDRCTVDIELGPWGSAFLVFRPGEAVAATAFPKEAEELLTISDGWRRALGDTSPQPAELGSWTEDKATKAFSGTARYETEVTLDASQLGEGRDIVLDLGDVGDVAEVLVNGRAAGVLWLRPYRVRITGLLKPGRNTLTVLVTNTGLNRVSCLERLPDVPVELQGQFGKTHPAYQVGEWQWTGQFWRSLGIPTDGEKGFGPLPPSGLMGPVRFITHRIGER